jgi:molybdopterin-guanine dinucleotide biosynthesis protein A
MKCGGIILCGGKSSRMGFAKAMLPFGPEAMLQRVARLLGAVVRPVVVVAAPGQELPPLAPEFRIVRDERESVGPLEGLRVGLSTLGGVAEMAFATSCDVPLLVPDFVRRIIELAEEGAWKVVAPEAEGFKHPLAAVYRTDLVQEIDAMLREGQRRPGLLFDRVPTRFVGADVLRSVDPMLNTLRNLNEPGEYLDALCQAGFELSPELRRWLPR